MQDLVIYEISFWEADHRSPTYPELFVAELVVTQGTKWKIQILGSETTASQFFQILENADYIDHLWPAGNFWAPFFKILPEADS